MSDEVPDPAEEFEDVDLENINTGFTEDDLEDVVDSVTGDEYLYSGVRCRVRKTEIESVEDDTITKSRQKFWVVGVQVDWPDDVMLRAQQFLESEIWDTDGNWLEVRAGHERMASREEAEDEVEWLAEQVVMLENDPNSPV